MKRVLAFLLLLCLSPGLFACSSPATDTTQETVETTAPAAGILDGKKFLFIGNSHTYVGNIVNQVYNQIPQQEKRTGVDRGFFYLLANRQGSEVTITNWTFSSHGLSSIFGGNCAVKGDCFGLDHESYMTDRYFDYVVIQPGVGISSEENIATDIAYVVDFFRSVNPDVQFVLLGNASVYGNNATSKPYPGITSYYKTLADQGFIIADWGKLVNDLIHGTTVPEGSTVPYDKNSFIIKDGFHPNYLSGYLGSLMLYCALTGESAADIPADLFQESAFVTMLEGHLERSYTHSATDTNCRIVLTTESELYRLHLLVDQYLAEKPYLEN